VGNLHCIAPVGAGTAGCLLASRLSKTFTVLLLEEGGPAPSLTVVPAFRTESASVEEINHYYKSVKQKHVSHKVSFIVLTLIAF